ARRATHPRRRVARPALSRRARTRERPCRRGDGNDDGGGCRNLCLRASGGAGMTINQSGWRPTAPEAAGEASDTFTGNRALMLEEPLLFEIGDTQTTGVDFDNLRAPAKAEPQLAGLERRRPIGLAGLTEPETVRHYTRLSRQNYAIDLGLFPLGSCTMKHNPRLNEKVARLPGFADVHPLQPQETLQGALQVINELAFWLLDLTGMHGVAMHRHAGAHDEACRLLSMPAALAAT